MKILESVSWGDFAFGAIVLGGIYYLGVFAYLKFIEKKRRLPIDEYEDVEHAVEVDGIEEESRRMERLLDDLEEKIRDIKAVLTEAGSGATKDMLLDRITPIVANYEGLLLPAYRYALNNSIIENARELCGIDFEEDEMNKVWDRIPR